MSCSGGRKPIGSMFIQYPPPGSPTEHSSRS
jgi:hypothetical protein